MRYMPLPENDFAPCGFLALRSRATTPSSLDVVVRVRPVSLFVSITTAPVTAPLGSVTVPHTERLYPIVRIWVGPSVTALVLKAVVAEFVQLSSSSALLTKPFFDQLCFPNFVSSSLTRRRANNPDDHFGFFFVSVRPPEIASAFALRMGLLS